MARIGLPAAAQREQLAGLGGRQRADDGDRLAATAHAQPHDAEAVRRVVEGDALDGTVERHFRLRRGRSAICGHESIRARRGCLRVLLAGSVVRRSHASSAHQIRCAAAVAGRSYDGLQRRSGPVDGEHQRSEDTLKLRSVEMEGMMQIRDATVEDVGGDCPDLQPGDRGSRRDPRDDAPEPRGAG